MWIPFVGVNRAMKDLLGSYFFHFSHDSGDLLGMSLDFSIWVVDPLEELGVRFQHSFIFFIDLSFGWQVHWIPYFWAKRQMKMICWFFYFLLIWSSWSRRWVSSCWPRVPVISGRKLFFNSRSGTPTLHLREFYFGKVIYWEFLELFLLNWSGNIFEGMVRCC